MINQTDQLLCLEERLLPQSRPCTPLAKMESSKAKADPLNKEPICLPIRVIAPVRVACQSHSSSICISACCTQNKVPCPATPCTPGHSEEDLEKMTIVTLKTCNVSISKQGPNPHPTTLPLALLPGSLSQRAAKRWGTPGPQTLSSELQKLPQVHTWLQYLSTSIKPRVMV